MNIIGQQVSKKELRKLIYEKLTTALAEYKDGIKEKKFTANLKKTSRLFALEVAKTVNKKKEKVKTHFKKKTKEVVEQQEAKQAS